jgi:hypothetical protein
MYPKNILNTKIIFFNAKSKIKTELFLFKPIDVVGTNTVKLFAKRIEGDVVIVCSASESMKSKSERTKKYSYTLLLFLPAFFVCVHAVSHNVKLVCVNK